MTVAREQLPIEHALSGSSAPRVGPLDPEAAPESTSLSELSDAQRNAIESRVLAIADDCMLLGHRDAEWTGQGPILEEDIAFSSMAQDELGHALVWYTLLHEHLDGEEPDDRAFRRGPEGWRNAQLFEQPRGDYAVSLMRRYLADIGTAIRYDAMRQSPVKELATAATKLRQEKKYHLIHNRTFVQRLGTANEDSRSRLQGAVEGLFPLALGIWEPTEDEDLLVTAGLLPRSALLGQIWLDNVCVGLRDAGLTPAAHEIDGRWHPEVDAVIGGRAGRHGPELETLLDAMQGMYRSDPQAVW